MADTQPDPPAAATTAPDEAEMTVLAPETQPEMIPPTDTDPIAPEPVADDLTTVVVQDPLYPGLSTPPQGEPVEIAVDDGPSEGLAAELYAEPAPVDAASPPAPSAAGSAESLLASIEPELRAQLHDTLEKIAWESFGDLTDAIVRQSVERVESIAWEVIPRMAETLIEEAIRRMQVESEDD
jgi:hypothetical protein